MCSRGETGTVAHPFGFVFRFAHVGKRTTASQTNLVIYITQLSSDAHIQLSSAARAALSSCAEAPEKAFWRAEALQRSILSAAGIHSRSPHKHLCVGCRAGDASDAVPRQGPLCVANPVSDHALQQRRDVARVL